MNEMENKESIFSKVFVQVVAAVIAAGILYFIGINSNGERAESGKRADTIENPIDNRTNKSNANSSREQTSEQYSKHPTENNLQNYPSPSNAEYKKENYRLYLNTSLPKSIISVIIVDANGNISNSTSNSIADIYKKTGKSASIGLIRSAFIKKPEFQELCEGNSEVIQKLSLSLYADYLAVGRIVYMNRAGTLVNGTIICTATLSMNIMSTNTNSLERSFTISNVNGNGVDELQAKEDAFQKLLDRYFNEYSSL